SRVSSRSRPPQMPACALPRDDVTGTPRTTKWSGAFIRMQNPTRTRRPGSRTRCAARTDLVRPMELCVGAELAGKRVPAVPHVALHDRRPSTVASPARRRAHHAVQESQFSCPLHAFHHTETRVIQRSQEPYI